MRVGLIGPRRSRTGTGPYVARFLRASGCEVLEWSRLEAARWLARPASAPPVDAVAVCSPPESHFDYIAAALGAGIHVFSEKPFVWPGDHSGTALRRLIGDLASIAAGAPGGTVVHENTQWPRTLNEYRRITGEFDPRDVREFACVFAPSGATPAEMIMETASHANSLLLAIGCTGAENISVEFRQPLKSRPAELEVRFESRSAGNTPVDVHYRFQQCEQQPRTAAYAVNGRWVRRSITSPGYQILFHYEGRDMKIADPMETSVREFAAKISPGARPPGEENLPLTIRENLEISAAILERIAGM